MTQDPFQYNYDADDFFDDSYDPELERSHLVNTHAEKNYLAAISKGAHPLDALDLGTDAAVIQAKFDIDSNYQPSPEEIDLFKRFCDL